ncbi:hypothetical protein KW783_00955 [Candidatus Parcubacteria bacterium]|nr:hypothetical protein [Candidatus Parcubacteria bacterium]
MLAVTMWELTALIAPIVVLGTPALLFLFAIVARELAEKDLFFTVVTEGQAKAILRNQRFYRAVMSFKKHRFRGNTDLTAIERAAIPAAGIDETDEELKRRLKVKRLTPAQKNLRQHYSFDDLVAKRKIDEWDIIPGEDTVSRLQKIPLIGKTLAGIRWVGLPPFATVYEYRFSWVSYEQKDEDGTLSAEKHPVPREEKNMRHILVQEYVYHVIVTDAETKEGVPVRIALLLTIAIVNPRKALFNVKHWLDAVTNQTEPDVREYIGTKEFEELYEDLSVTSEALKKSLKQLDHFLADYGADVRLVQVQTVDPSGEDARRYRTLSTRQYEADQNAKKTRTDADAERYRIENTLHTIAREPGAVVMYQAEQEVKSAELIANSKTLTTWVRSGQNTPLALPLAPAVAQPAPPPQQPRPAANPPTGAAQIP